MDLQQICCMCKLTVEHTERKKTSWKYAQYEMYIKRKEIKHLKIWRTNATFNMREYENMIKNNRN